VWHILAKETVNFKQGSFFVYKSDIPKNMFAFVQQEKAREHLIGITRQDNISEIKKTDHSGSLQDWKLETNFEITAHRTPQQNSYGELAFTVIALKTRAVLNVAQILKSKCFKL